MYFKKYKRDCATDLKEGEYEADSEVGEPVDGARDHEGSRPGRLPEHLGGHHIRNGTWREIPQMWSTTTKTVATDHQSSGSQWGQVYIYNIQYIITCLVTSKQHLR